MREQFEAIMRKTFGEEVKLSRMMTITGEQSDEYRHPSVRHCWTLFSALAAQVNANEQQAQNHVPDGGKMVQAQPTQEPALPLLRMSEFPDQIIGKVLMAVDGEIFMFKEIQPEGSKRWFFSDAKGAVPIDEFIGWLPLSEESPAIEPEENKEAWCYYIATMIGVYLNEPVDSDKCKAIQGIIQRRLWAYPKSQAQEPESPWISVEDRLPEMETPVIALVGKNTYALSRVDYEEGWLWGIGCNNLNDARNYEADDDYQPTHWMPLPPAPVNVVNKPEGGA